MRGLAHYSALQQNLARIFHKSVVAFAQAPAIPGKCCAGLRTPQSEDFFSTSQEQQGIEEILWMFMKYPG